MELFTGIEYLKIAVANSFGLDKISWKERIEWFDKNNSQSKIMDLIRNGEPDEPAMMYGAYKAYQDAIKGIPSGFPITLDATSSGIQILSALIRDKLASTISNVVDAGYRSDAYTFIYEYMQENKGIPEGIDKEGVKKAIMTSLYSSIAKPLEVFGKDNIHLFHETMNELVPGIWDLNQMFLYMWNPNTSVYRWKLPNNFHVVDRVMVQRNEIAHFYGLPIEVVTKVNAPKEDGRSLGANITHSCDAFVVNEMSERCSYTVENYRRAEEVLSGSTSFKSESEKVDEMVETLWKNYKESGYLSARILRYLRSDNVSGVDLNVVNERVFNTLPLNPFDLMTIHDAYRCLPNYGNDLRQQYNTIMSQIIDSNLLDWILSQITGKKLEIVKVGHNYSEEALLANYSLS